MRLKTFLAAYFLFLCILFVSVGVISVHMTNSTVRMLRDKGEREFQTITTSLARDIAALYGRFGQGRDFQDSVSQIVSSYVVYYRRHGIELSMTHMDIEGSRGVVVAFVQDNESYFITATGVLPYPFRLYRLDYSINITESITDMQQIQRVLLITSIVFSLIAAVFLYAIMLWVFKPLEIVAHASQQIADGMYSERIVVKGQNELSSVAIAFNRMATQIENQIYQLEEEALGKQRFVDNFAHEIRTPLTSIYGYAEYLQKTTLDESELIESTGYIMSEADHMKKVANSLLELATLRNYQPIIGNICLPQLFEDVKQTLKNPLQERGVQLVCNASAETLLGQADLIKTLLLNLCTNAIASCCVENGKIYVESSSTDGGKLITLSVLDNGCGIPEDKLSKIIEPFFRVDKARNRASGGVGLGLTLCKQIADVHDAEMVITSVKEQGTVVKIIFTNP